VMEPETRYARSGDVRVAYQIVGDGPRDLVLAPGYVSHVELTWEHPSYERFIRRLASFARVIVFDKRGSGLSDPVDEAATIEERMDDIRAVMDAANSERPRTIRGRLCRRGGNSRYRTTRRKPGARASA
jgi:pimeloyl-ACP methyl ester carboxylesterase